jgi:hypothetical protein
MIHALTIILVILKALEMIDWPWVWVLAPSWLVAVVWGVTMMMAIFLQIVGRR